MQNDPNQPVQQVPVSNSTQSVLGTEHQTPSLVTKAIKPLSPKVYYALFFITGFITCLLLTALVQSGVVSINVHALNKKCEVDVGALNVFDIEDSLEQAMAQESTDQMYKIGVYMSESPGVYASYGYSLLHMAAEEGNECATSYLKQKEIPLVYQQELSSMRKELLRMREQGRRDPAERLGEARNSQRRSDVNTILNALYQYAIDNNGKFPTAIPQAMDSAIEICASNGSECGDFIDLSEYLVGDYLVSIPKDPKASSGNSTKYSLLVTKEGRLTIASMESENGQKINVTR